MKGATSWGPRAWVTMSATASTAAWPTRLRREKAARIGLDHARREVLRADPDGDRQEHRAGHERRRLAPAREEPGDHVPGDAERLRPEEDPREADDVEGDEPPPEVVDPGEALLRLRPVPLAPEALGAEPDAVDQAPGDERPPRAVPEPAEQHRQEQVAVRDRRAAAAPAERDVEVVAEPAGERHVPPPPEVLERDGGVRGVEVLRELEAEQERDADGDVRVAGEVGVDLHRVGVDRDQDLERRVLVRVGEDLVDDVTRRGSSRSPPS